MDWLITLYRICQRDKVVDPPVVLAGGEWCNYVGLASQSSLHSALSQSLLTPALKEWGVSAWMVDLDRLFQRGTTWMEKKPRRSLLQHPGRWSFRLWPLELLAREGVKIWFRWPDLKILRAMITSPLYLQ